MQEREISLVDVIVEILLRWRMIVIAMLVGGVLLGGYSYLRSSQTAKRNQAKIAELEQQVPDDNEETSGTFSRKTWLEQQLTLTQLNNVETVLTYEELYADKEEYYNNSIYMQTDANHVPIYDFIFVVEAESAESTNYLVQAYKDILGSNGLREYLAEKMQVSPDYIGELVVLGGSTYEQYQPSNKGERIVLEEQAGNTLRGYVRYNTAEGCELMGQSLIDYVNSQQAAMTAEMGEHTLTLLQHAASTMVDTSLLNNQNVYRKDIFTLKKEAAKLKDAFTDEEWKYYDYLLANKAAEGADAEEKNPEEVGNDPIAALQAASHPSVSKKYILLGMVLFAFVYAVAIFLKYILDNRIRAVDDIQELFGISKLGQIPVSSGNKKLFGFVDNWILSIRNMGKRKFSSEEAVGLAAVAIKISAQKQGLSTVYCLGCGLKGRTVEVCNKLKELLAADNVELKILNNVLYDAQTMEELSDAKGAVLVETAGATYYNEIVQELELLKRQEIAVLGGVVVE